MDAQIFLDNFGTIADAPGGVDRLRELILDLAVRGQLVPQDLADGDAKHLLDQAATAKKQLIENGEVLKSRPLPNDDSGVGDAAFTIPPNWKWVRLDDVAVYIQRGKGPTYVENSGVPVVSQKCIQNSGFDLARARFVDEATLASYGSERFLRKGDLLWNSTGTGTVGRINVFPGSDDYDQVVADSHVTVVRTVVCSPRYLHCWLSSPEVQSTIEDRTTGTTKQQELNTSTVRLQPVPLPPRAEQERIVAKVDELMQLCDDLETRQQARHQITTRLRASSLDVLTNAETADDLHTAWSRIHTNWDALTDHPDSIDALRQTVLQLAVEGRLANSDAADASADELLEAIRPGAASRTAIDRSVIPYDVPAAWRWVHLESVCSHIVDCLHKTPRYAEDGYPAIRTSDVEPGRILVDKARLVDKVTFEERTSRLRPAAGDVVYSREGGRFGIAAVVPPDVDLCLGQRMMQFRCTDGVEPEYLCWFLNSPLGFGQASADVGGSASPHVNIKAIRRFLLPLPPSAEQQRIVARVRELMDQCDQLEARLGLRDRVGALLAGSMASAAAC